MNKSKTLFALFVALLTIAFVLSSIYFSTHYDNATSLFALIMFVLFFDALFAFYVINSNRSPNTKISWLAIFAIIPLVGPILFLLFGVNPFLKKAISKRRDENKKISSFEDFSFSEKILASNEYIPNKLAYDISNRPIYDKNNIKLISNVYDFFPEYIKLVRSAKSFINIQTYIITDGFFSRILFAELILKAKEGVKIRLMYDWVGCKGRMNKDAIKELEANGIEVSIFNPRGFTKFKSSTNFRGHRKILIVDNKWAIYGGSNIGDEYINMYDGYPTWEDLNIIIEGQAVNTLNILFCSDWTSHSSKNNPTDIKLIENDYKKLFMIHKSENPNAEMQVLESNPNYVERLVKSLIINGIFNAKKSIKIIQPYFMPPDEILEALKIALSKGVKIEVICPGKNDNKKFVRILNRSNYLKLLYSENFSAYEFDGFIHSKMFIFDDTYTLFGTCNLDYRALYINFESLSIIRSDESIKLFKDKFESNKKDSLYVTADIIKKDKTLVSSIKSSLLALIYPLL